MTPDRIIVVTRKTRLQELIRRFNTKSQAKFYVESRGLSFDDYLIEDANYEAAKRSVLQSIPRSIRQVELDRQFLPNYIFAQNDLVLSLGQDGLVVNIAKYLDGQPILAVNPDPERFDGILLPFLVRDVKPTIDKFTGDALSMRPITMAKAALNDGQQLLAFNDLFIGPKTHASARYCIEYRGSVENQSSSGIIVSTPAGSTGWMSSIFNQSKAVSEFSWSRSYNNDTNKDNTDELPVIEKPQLQWEERRLLFAVREPFQSQVSKVNIAAGFIDQGEFLKLESHMPENGVIFSDGMEWDFLEFNSGITAQISISEKCTNLLIV